MGEVNDPIKGPSARFRQPSILRMVIRPDASTAQNYIEAVSAPFDELGRQHGLGLDPPLANRSRPPRARKNVR